MVNEIPSTFFDFQVLYTCGTKLEVVNIAADIPIISIFNDFSLKIIKQIEKFQKFLCKQSHHLQYLLPFLTLHFLHKLSPNLYQPIE